MSDISRNARYLQREQSRTGRAVNNVTNVIDNALVATGAALTFSRNQIQDARESTRELQAKQTALRLAREQRSDPGKPRAYARSNEMER